LLVTHAYSIWVPIVAIHEVATAVACCLETVHIKLGSGRYLKSCWFFGLGTAQLKCDTKQYVCYVCKS